MTAKVGSVVAVLGCALVFAPAALAAGTITAVGTAQEKVTPKDPKDNQSIRDAVEAAHKASIPAAISGTAARSTRRPWTSCRWARCCNSTPTAST